MSGFKFHTYGEARWWAAYVRYLAQQRGTEPTGSRRPDDTYGYIAPQRKAVLRANARALVRDLYASTEKYPATAAERLGA